MRRPVMSKLSFLSIRGMVCITLSLASMFIFAGPGRTQSLEKFTLKSDRNNPLKAPTKPTTSAKSQPSNKPGQTNKSASQDAIFAPLSGCVLNDLLVLDTVRIVFVEVFTYPPNSAIPVTVTQTNAGVVGYALAQAGPFAATLNIVVNTDSNGYGKSADVYTQGQVVGTTVTYGETPYGPTNSVNLNVLPQCNCPQIPVVP